ncbi:lymphatic vessel endothelial hyaluronic acid receptor 1a [Salarias fasciatus]|uniref:lymphatic vessel endothelial hyaluronic acid receptor 1a n=1 Tax=Salarias fasciatus TaxID=181472 RepID=UPI001176D631|nr:lymphatic vessel endothelial hyaluronic acid receptor 1 [Salarias fasciatus]
MNIFCLCITSVLAITSVFSDQNSKKNHMRFFPAADQSIAGVFLVTVLHLGNPQYFFNASEARSLCSSLGVSIATKEQVEKAITRGLETCRFGWIDENFAVIPRIHPLITCGRNKTGLVPWRASLNSLFDVFCFNESDAAAQLKDATTDTPRNSTYHSARSSPATQKTYSAFSAFLHSSSSTPEIIDIKAEPARNVGGAQRSTGGRLVLITCTSAFLVIAVVITAYLKLHRRCSESSDEKNQHEYIETEESACVRSMKDTEKSAPQDENIEVEDEE